MISRINIFAPGSVGMVDRRVWPLGPAGAWSGDSPSIVHLDILRCGSIAGHADLAGLLREQIVRIPTVAGRGGKFDLPNR